jgi:hypothetical protein
MAAKTEPEIVHVRIVEDDELTPIDILKNPIVIALGSVVVTKLATRWMDRAFEKIDERKGRTDTDADQPSEVVKPKQ